ncbi:MAG: threonine/serine dehydratase [Kordiimonas sp.]
MTDWQQKIEQAYKRMHASAEAPYQTALEHSAYYSSETGCNIYLKQEHMQKTGSFKYRGALNKLSSLTPQAIEKGVITASSGNHGMASSLAASKLSIPITIHVPEAVSPAKLAGIELYGATIHKVAGSSLDAELSAKETAEREHSTFISPYNDPDIVAGQGTIGLEIIEQLADVDAVIVSVGGGGLISGIGSYIKAVKPNTDIIACWPENSPAMYECMKAGEIFDVPETDTLSDGTAGGVEPGSITFELCQKVIDQNILVTEAEIQETLKEFAAKERQMIEGSAAVAVAAAKKVADNYKGKNVAVVLCGRNISLEKFTELTK